MAIQKKIFNPHCKNCELKREHYCNGTFEKGIPNCERFEDYHYETACNARRPKRIGRYGDDRPKERCPLHGDPVWADPDSILIQREPFYIHYDNIGATGLNEHINNPEFLDSIRHWYKSRGFGVRLVKKSGAGCPYYAVYVGRKLK